MNEPRGRIAFPLVLLFGAMVFGMVLAGGLDWTPSGEAAPDSAVGAVSVAVPAVGGLPSFADLADAVSPAVASIQVKTIEKASTRRRQDPFQFFFGPRGRQQQQGEGEEDEPQERRSDSAGSGFVISADGLLVTNFHVIDGATEVIVHVNGEDYPAEVKGTDPATDIALLQLDTNDQLPYLALGDSDRLRVGDWIMVIGSPLRLENSVSVGVVSAKGRSINITPDRSLENFIQTDAAINFGNSGGPLVDLQGRVVGIATAINYGAENIGFAVPVTTLDQVLPQLREHGEVKRGYLGVTIQDVNERYAQAFGLEDVTGVIAQNVTGGGPSDDAGLENGDILLEVDGRTIEDTRSLIDYVSALPPGHEVGVLVYRRGERLEKTVELGERPLRGTNIQPTRNELPEEQTIEWLGLTYQDLSEAIRNNHSIPEDVDGVFIREVAASSPLYDENVIAGDVIVSVANRAIAGVEDFESIVKDAATGSVLPLYVRRFDPRSGTEVGSFYALIDVP